MFYSFNAEFAGMDCKYCFSTDELDRVCLSVRKNDEKEQLMFDFSRKLHEMHEAAVLPDTVLVFENNRYADEVYLRLRNAKIVKPQIMKTNLRGVAVAICGLADDFLMCRDGFTENMNAAGCIACA